MKNGRKKQEQIHLGAHGEDYGNWMPVSMLWLVGGLAALAAVISLLSFAVFHITALGVVFVIAALLLLALLLWITWIRRQYAFGGGGMMEQVHQVVLSHLDFDGQGQLIWILTGRDSFWMWGAVPGLYPSGRPSPGGRPRWWASTIGALPTAMVRPCARKMPRARA